LQNKLIDGFKGSSNTDGRLYSDVCLQGRYQGWWNERMQALSSLSSVLACGRVDEFIILCRSDLLIYYTQTTSL
jgi:hypothetical protein